METLNWSKLDSSITKDTKKIPYNENKHMFTKIAFDVYSRNSSSVESLWILEDGDDGVQYLVAQYDEEELPLEAKGCWEALSNKSNDNITLFYKGIPLQKFASEEFGFNKDDIHIFKKMLIEKISNDKCFVTKFLKSKSQEDVKNLVSKFPELKTFII